MDKFTDKKHFIGVDISHQKLDLSLLHASKYEQFNDKVVVNDLNGFDAILEWLKKHTVQLKDCVFCMEHTGTYGLLFFAWLSQMKIDYCVKPALEIKKSLGIIRGKNDQVDARRIASYAITHRFKLEPYHFPSGVLLQIKQLLTYRDQQVRICTALKNSLKSHQQYQRVSGLELVTQEIERQIIDFEKRIVHIEKKVVELIKSDENLNKNYNLAKSVIGVAFVIASYLLVTTNNFTSFDNGREYACYSGIAPFKNESGTSIRGRTKVSNLANKKVKAILSNGANSAVNWDPEMKRYYHRKLAEGKDHNLIINAVRCKIVNRVFAVVKRQTPYVKIYQQNFA